MLGVPGKCDLINNRKKRNENALSYKRQPKVQEKKRSFEYNTRNAAAPLSCKGSQPPFKACDLASATFPASSPAAPDQLQVLQQNGPTYVALESILSFSGGCSPVIIPQSHILF